MNPLGNQHIAEFINCSSRLLNDETELKEMFRRGIKAAGLDLITITAHQFDPIGVTCIAIIGESHIAIHTYPEAKHASLDIFTCSGTTKKHNVLLKFFREKLKPKAVRYVLVERGNPLDIKQADWTSAFSRHGFEVKYHIKKQLVNKKTKLQKIDIVQNETFGRMLFLDKDLQIAEADIGIYDQNLIQPLCLQKKNLGRVCILGGGDGAVLNALLKAKPREVMLVDSDKEVISLSKKHLKGICGNSFSHKNVEIIIEDASKYLKKKRRFDAIIYDLTMRPETQSRMQRTQYLKGLFMRIARSLSRRGIFTMQCCSEHDKDNLRLIKRLLPQYFNDVSFHSAYIPSFCEWWVFATAVKK